MPEMITVENKKMLQFSREEVEATFIRAGCAEELATSLTKAVMGTHDKIAFGKEEPYPDPVKAKINPPFQMASLAQETFFGFG